MSRPTCAPNLQSAGAAVLLLLIPAIVNGQEEQAARQVRPSVQATRLASPPVIDGNLQDPAWLSTARLGDFVQQQPIEGAPATEATEVLVGYDDETLYLGIRARYSDVGLIRASRADRDQIANDDSVTFFFDPFLDQQRGYAFAVNAFGVQGDHMLASNTAVGGQSSTGDATWNALFRSAGTLTEDGWTAEVALPIKSLRYPGRGAGEPHQWGFQVVRAIRGKNETVSWAPISTNVSGFLTQMGVLEGMRDLSTHRTLELMPTLTAISAGTRSASAGFETSHLQEGGVNVKYGFTSNLTLDFTYNPDFSQIESDRQQIAINQRFPLFFPELRPFFLEGKEIFAVQGAVTFFHTRTIVDPRVGAKLTGKMGRATVGVLVTDDEAPGKVSPGEAAFDRRAMTAAARVKYDLYGDSYLGALVTDREFLDTHSRMFELDGQIGLGKFHQTGYRYLIADHLDGTGRRAVAPLADVYVRRDSRNFTWLVAQHFVPPDLKIDSGFIQRPDQKRTFGWTYYRWWPGDWLTSWGPRYDYERIYDYAGTLTDERHGGRLDAVLANNITLGAGVNRELERFNGIDFRKTQLTASATINTNRRILVRGNLTRGDEIRFVENPYLGHSTAYSATVTFRPTARLQSEFTLNGTRFIDVRRDALDFDVRIYRALTTYQFTPRLLIRNILEGNTLNRTLGVNVLATYRVNGGTVFFVGYDDRYRDDDVRRSVDPVPLGYVRTNRAVFAKLQYLYRN